jgi:TPR repeat protein
MAKPLHQGKHWESRSDSFYVVQDDRAEDDDALTKQAESGNFLKECQLAQRCLDAGDFKQALAHYTSAARRGSASALFNQALMLEKGMGVDEKSTADEFMALYRRAAAKGVAQAKHRLGFHLALTGDDGCGGIDEGVAFIRAAAEDGLHGAMYDYGMMLMHGVSVAQDEKLGVKWLCGAVDANISPAAFELAVYYSRPSNAAGEEEADADARMKRAAGFAHRAAEDGHALAQDLLGQFYLKGNGVGIDSAAAYECFTAAAKQGVLSSKRDRAMLLEVGKGCTANQEEAVQIYRDCARAGDVMSKFRLGMCYYYGIGGLKTKHMIAGKHIRVAAEAGVIPAKAFLLMRDLTAGGEEEDRLRGEIAAIAADGAHPNRIDAIGALVSLGLLEACKACGVTKHEISTALMVCARCNKVKYCSKACQESHWPKHRDICGEAERNAEEKEAVDTVGKE